MSRGPAGNDLLDRLAADAPGSLDRGRARRRVGEPLSFVGTAEAQARPSSSRWQVVARHPDAAAYRPEPIL